MQLGAADFDFEHGRWSVRHRRLKARLCACTEWEEFHGTADVRPVLGGLGNVEDNLLHLPDGDYRAIAIRSFDPITGLWAIWWLDQRSPRALDTPVKGRFIDGCGQFFADDMHAGQPVLLRFQWHQNGGTAPVWDQALSADGGKTWETNWIMNFSPR